MKSVILFLLLPVCTWAAPQMHLSTDGKYLGQSIAMSVPHSSGRDAYGKKRERRGCSHKSRIFSDGVLCDAPTRKCCKPQQGPPGPAGTDSTSDNYVFAYDTTVQAVGTGLFTNITFDTNAQLDGWSHTPGTSEFTNAQTGLYLVTYRTQINRTGGGTQELSARAALGGGSTEVPGSVAYVEIGGGGANGLVTATFLLDYNTANDPFVIQVATQSGGGTIVPTPLATTAISASLTIIRIL